MTAPIVFMDTETVGFDLGPDVIWEFAGVRRHPDPDRPDEVLHLFIEHDLAKAASLPDLFRTDHDTRYDPAVASTREDAAHTIHAFLEGRGAGKPHIVGAVPNFDTERLRMLMEPFGLTPPHHYHLIDVENLVVGYLAGKGIYSDLPWDSDELSRVMGVDVPVGGRHTAMGDVRWAMALYERVMSR